MNEVAPKPPVKLIRIFFWAMLPMVLLLLIQGFQVFTLLKQVSPVEGAAILAGRLLIFPLLVVGVVAAYRSFRKPKPSTTT